MTVFMDRPSTHMCHVCSTEYKIQHLRLTRRPQPPCCPACDAPLRTSGECIPEFLLLRRGGAPIQSQDSSEDPKLPELFILWHARTCADIDAIIADTRAEFSWLRIEGSAAPSAQGGSGNAFQHLLSAGVLTAA